MPYAKTTIGVLLLSVAVLGLAGCTDDGEAESNRALSSEAGEPDRAEEGSAEEGGGGDLDAEAASFDDLCSSAVGDVINEYWPDQAIDGPVVDFEQASAFVGDLSQDCNWMYYGGNAPGPIINLIQTLPGQHTATSAKELEEFCPATIVRPGEIEELDGPGEITALILDGTSETPTGCLMDLDAAGALTRILVVNALEVGGTPLLNRDQVRDVLKGTYEKVLIPKG